MGRKIGKAAGIIACLLLLPLVATMFFSGAPLSVGNQEAKEALSKSKEKNATYTVDDYIMMAMAANIDPGMNMETLKAQAVIIRTTIYEKLRKNSQNSLTVDEIGLDTIPLSELKGQVSVEEYETEVSNFENAIYSTRGQILTYGGEPIRALFHYANTGRTRSYEEAYKESIPYLVSVDSSRDVEAEVGVTTKEYSKGEFLHKLMLKYTITELTEDNLLEQLAIKEKEKTGYVHTVNAGKLEISGEAFAGIFGLNSTNFYFEEKEGAIRIVCRGKGSGIGFSQYGADCMAKNGSDYRKMLSYYYRGTVISKVS